MAAPASPQSAFNSALPGTSPSRRAFPVFPGPFDPNGVGGKDAPEHLHRLQHAVRGDNIGWRGSQPAGISGEDRRDSAGWYAASDGAVSLKPALDAVNADVAAAQAKVDAAVAGQRVDRTDVAAQLSADRFWRRTERQLDAIKDSLKLATAAHDLVANAPDAELPVISEELESYLQSRNIPTDWLNTAIAQRIPGLDELRADAALKAKRRDVLAANNAALLKAFNNGTPPPELVDPYAAVTSAKPYSNGEPE